MADYLFIGEAVAALLVLGVLFRHGLAAEDGLFVAYLCWFCFITAALWVVAQSQPESYAYWYFAMNGLGLLLALHLVWQAPVSWAGTQIVFLCGTFFAVLLWRDGDWTTLAMGLAASMLVAFGLAALVASWQVDAVSGFDQVKYQGLALFWLSQAAPAVLYFFTSSRSPEWVDKAGLGFAAFGLCAFAWMALSFSFIGLEGATAVAGSHAPALAPLWAWLERRGQG